MTQKVITGDKDLDKWISFFYFSGKSNTKFINLLKKTDKYFLTISPPPNDEIDFYDMGLLEEDFRKVAFSENLPSYDEDENNEKEEDTIKYIDEKSRLVIAIQNGVNFKNWQKKYGNVFFEVIEKSLIDGDYEKYNIEFSKVLKICVENNYIKKNDFFEISLSRGAHLGKKYDTLEKEKNLKKEKFKNKIKIFLDL